MRDGHRRRMVPLLALVALPGEPRRCSCRCRPARARSLRSLPRSLGPPTRARVRFVMLQAVCLWASVRPWRRVRSILRGARRHGRGRRGEGRRGPRPRSTAKAPSARQTPERNLVKASPPRPTIEVVLSSGLQRLGGPGEREGVGSSVESGLPVSVLQAALRDSLRQLVEGATPAPNDVRLSRTCRTRSNLRTCSRASCSGRCIPKRATRPSRGVVRGQAGPSSGRCTTPGFRFDRC
jgi:hypothetical protein